MQLFNPNTAQISKTGEQYILDVINRTKAQGRLANITISHCIKTESYQDNADGLSQNRVCAVKNFLVSHGSFGNKVSDVEFCIIPTNSDEVVTQNNKVVMSVEQKQV